MSRALLLAAMALALSAATVVEHKGIRAELQGLIDHAQHSLDMSLGCLDDAAFEARLAAAAGRGVKVRLLLQPRLRANRQAAFRLAKAGIELRFSDDIEARAIIADLSRVAVGSFDAYPKLLDERSVRLDMDDDEASGAELGEQFNQAWKQSHIKVPESLSLKDELDDLPDPTEREPRLKTKRRVDKS